MESLESRVYLSITVGVTEDGVARFFGTDDADVVVIRATAQDRPLEFSINGGEFRTDFDPAQPGEQNLRVTDGRVSCDLGGGDDRVIVSVADDEGLESVDNSFLTTTDDWGFDVRYEHVEEVFVVNEGGGVIASVRPADQTSDDRTTPVPDSADVVEVTDQRWGSGHWARGPPDSTELSEPGAGGGEYVRGISESDLSLIAAEAMRRWLLSPLAQGHEAELASVHVVLRDLPGLALGQARGLTVVIDPTAGGFGWFVDRTPWDDAEFTSAPSGELDAAEGSLASGRFDLLSVMMHEIGHVMGLDDVDPSADPGDLMAGSISAGERRLPSSVPLANRVVHGFGSLWDRNVVIDLTSDLHVNGDIVWDDMVVVHGAITVTATGTITLLGSGSIVGDSAGGSDDLVLAGDGAVTIRGMAGGDGLRDLDVRSGNSVAFTGASVSLTGALSVSAVSTVEDTQATSIVGVLIEDTTIEAATVSISAVSSVTAETDGIPGVFGFDRAAVEVESRATVAVTGTTRIESAGSVDILASSEVRASAEAFAWGGIVTADAAIARSTVTSEARAEVSGDTAIVAGGAFRLRAVDDVTATTIANGEAAGAGGAGGSMARATLDGTSLASVTDSAGVSASEIEVSATSRDEYATTATSTSGGASENGPEILQTLTDAGAETSDGAVSLAAAVAVTNFSRLTWGYIATDGVLESGGDIVIGATSGVSSGTRADASGTQSSTGVGVAVAVSNGDVVTEGYVDGPVTLSAASVEIGAGVPDGSRHSFSAEAVSGAGAEDVGVAGSVAINIVGNRAEALLKPGAVVEVGGANVSLAATNESESTAKALASEEGATGSDVGFGASFALNIAENMTRAELRSGSVLTGARDLALVAAGSHTMVTEAKAGGTSSGGTGIAGVVAISISNNDTIARLGDGPTLIVAGSLTLSATHSGSTSGRAEGDSESASVGVGLAIAVTVARDMAVATTRRGIEAAGDVGFGALSAGSSAAEAVAGVEGGKDEDSSSGDIDSEVTRQMDHADMVGQDNLGPDGGTNGAEPPGAETSDGAVTVAGAVAVNVGSSKAHAYVPNNGSVTAGGMLSLRASNNSDASANADGSTTGDAATGVGAAIALNIIRSETLAYIGSGAAVSAAGIEIAARMTDSGGDSQSVSSAEAESGAGSDSVGVAGSLAINIAGNRSEARIRPDAAVSGGGGAVSLRVVNSTSATAKALTADGGASGSDVGVGASVALNIVKNQALAELGSGASLIGVGDLTLSASGSHAVVTEAEAGSESSSGVGVAGGIGVSVANNDTIARLGDGPALSTSGSVTLSAVHSGSTSTKGRGSTKSGTVGVGIGLAITVANDDALATTARGIAAGGAVTFEALGSAASSAEGTAGAEGGKDESSATEDVDTLVDDELTHADDVGTDNLGSDGGTDDAEAPSPDTSDGSVTVAAAVGVNIGVSRARAYVPDSGSVSADGLLTLSASNNTDASAKGDGSTTGDAATGVGAAVALNVATSYALAYIGEDASVTASGVLIGSRMTDVGGDATSTFAAEAISGAGSTDVGVAGSLAINTVGNRVEAFIKPGADVSAGGGAVSLEAAGTSSSSAKALTAGLGATGDVGVGASVALNIANNVVRSELQERARLIGAGALTLTAAGAHSMESEAVAGSAGGTAVSPAVALSIPVSRSLALVSSEEPLMLAGGMAMSSSLSNDVTTEARGDAAGTGTGVGASVAVAVVVATAKAELHSSVDAQGDVRITADAAVSSAVDGKASAVGLPDIPGTDIDQEVARQLAYGDPDIEPPSVTDAVDEANNASLDETKKEIAKVGVAATVAVNVVTSRALAMVLEGLEITTTGAFELSSAMATSADADAIGNALIAQTAVGAAVALNVATVINRAEVGDSARVTAGDVAVRAALHGGEASGVSALGVSIGGSRKVGVAGSIGVNVVVLVTEALVGADTVVTSGAGLAVAATGELGFRAIAGGGATGSSAGVGASIGVNVLTSRTEASVGDRAVLLAPGALAVAAQTTIAPQDGDIPGDPSAGVAGGAVAGTAGVAGSFAVSIITESTLAHVGANTRVNQGEPGGPAQSVIISAIDETTISDAAGAISAAKSVGVGIGLDLVVFKKTTEATLGEASIVHAGGDVVLRSDAREDIFSLAGSIAAAGSTGVGGAISVLVLTTPISAGIGDGGSVTANGNVVIEANHDGKIELIAGTAGAAGTTGVGAAVATLIRVDTTTATIGEGASVTADSAYGPVPILTSTTDADGARLRREHRGLAVTATSGEDTTTIAIGGAGAGTAGVAGSATANVFVEVTRASVGEGSMVRGAGVALLAADDTDLLSIAGALAGGGTAGIGAALDVGVLTKVTEAYLDPTVDLVTTGDVAIEADSDERVLSITANVGIGGSTGVGGSVGTYVITTTTEASVRGQAGAPTVVSAGGDVEIAARGSADIDLIAGGVAGGGTAGVGISNATLVQTDTVRAFVGPDVGVVSRGGAGVSITADSDTDVFSIAAGGGLAGSAGVAGSATVGVITQITRAFIDTGTTVDATNADAGSHPGLTIRAVGYTTRFGIAGAVAGGGAAGVGAGVDVVVLTKQTEAYAAPDTHAAADGSVAIDAESDEHVISVSAAISGGGSAGIAGTAGVSVLTIGTRACIDNAETPLDRVTVDVGGSVAVTADGRTEIDLVSGNVSGAGAVSIGAAAGVPVVVKSTEAYIGRYAQVDARGENVPVMVRRGGFLVGYIPNAEAVTFDPGSVDGDTDTISIAGGHNFVTGQGVTYDAGGGDVIGGLTDGRVYYVIADESDPGALRLATTRSNARAGIAIDLDPTSASGTSHTLSPDGEVASTPPAPGNDFNNDGTEDTNDPSFSLQRVSTPAISPFRGVAVSAVSQDDIESIAVSGGGAGAVAVNIGGTVHVYSSDTLASVAENTRVTAGGGPEPASVLVDAQSDFYHLAVAGGISIAGTVSVTPSVDVVVVDNETHAWVAGGADVDASGNVEVAAEAAEDLLVIAAGVAGSGLVSVGGSVPVVVIASKTHADIGELSTGLADAAHVAAGGSVRVSAEDNTDLDMIAGSLGIGIGAVGVGASVGVAVIAKDTVALIGPFAEVDALGAGDPIAGVFNGEINDNGFPAMSASGVIVQAYSSENLLSVAIAGAFGFYAGVAGGVTVEVIKSDTTALIGALARVNQGAGAPDETQSVHVSAANDVKAFAVGGSAGGGIAGIAGGVDVGVVRNDVFATIGAGAKVAAASDVAVNALARKDVDTVAVSVGAGIVGVAGSVSVWTIGARVESSYTADGQSEDVLDNDVVPFADSMANGDDQQSGYLRIIDGYEGPVFDPQTRLDPENDTIDLSATGHSFSTGDPVVYRTNGGTAIDGLEDGETYYVIVDRDDINKIYLAQSPEDAMDRVAMDLELGMATGDTHRLDPLVGAATDGAGSSIDDSAPDDPVSDAVNAEDAPKGTVATIGAGAEVVAGGDVSVRAEEEVGFFAFVGDFAAGGVAVGASIGIATIRGGTAALVEPGASITASESGRLLVRAKLTENTEGKSIAGRGGAAALGAQVIVLTDRSSQFAAIGDGVVVSHAGDVRVEADASRSLDANTIGVLVGLVFVTGVSVTTATIGPSALDQAGVEGVTSATIGHAAIGSEVARVGDVSVVAQADDEISSTPFVVGATIGANAQAGAIATSKSDTTVEAGVGGATIHSDGDVLVRAAGSPDLRTKADGLGFAIEAVGGAFAKATIGGSVSANVDNGALITTVGAGVVRILAEADRPSSRAETFAATGGGLGVSAVDAKAELSMQVSARVEDTTIASGGGVLIRSAYVPTAVALGDAFAGGAVAVGAALSKTIVGGSATASVGGNSHIDAGIGAESTPGSAELPGVRILADAIGATAQSTSKAAAGGVAGGAGADANADLALAVTALVVASTVRASGDVLVRGQYEPLSDATARGSAGGVLAAGAALARATLGGSVDARVVGGSQLQAGMTGEPADVSIVARSNSAMAQAEAGAYGGGVATGVGVSITSTTTVSANAAVLRSTLTATRNVAVEAVLAPSAIGESDGAAGGLVAGGASLATTTIDATTAASIGENSVVSAGAGSIPGDVSVWSRSVTYARALANATSGGLATGNAARATATVTQDTQALTGRNSNVEATRDATITSESISRLDVDLDGTAIGVAAAGDVRGKAELYPYTRSLIGTDSQITAGRDVEVYALTSVPQADVTARGGKGGLIGLGGQDVSSRIDGARTITSIGTGAVLRASREVGVTSTARIDVSADARQTAAGGVTSNRVDARAKLIDCQTIVLFNTQASAEAEDVRIAASDEHVFVKSQARSETTIAEYSDSTADAVADVYTNARVTIGEGAMIRGRSSVSISALSEDVGSRTYAAAKTLGYAGDTLAISDNDLRPKSTNVYRAGSHIITNSFLIESQAPHYAQNYERTAVAETKTVTKLVKVVVGTVCEWVLGLFGLEQVCQPVYDWVEEVLPSTEDKLFYGQKAVTNEIEMDGEVTITGPPSPLLEVDADGNIVRAEHVSLLPGGDDEIVVDDIINRTGGSLTIRAANGTVSGTPTFNLNTAFEEVRLTNSSDKALVINDIRTVRDDPPEFSLTVRENGADQFDPAIHHNLSEVSITSAGANAGEGVVLRGAIVNPRGLTSIESLRGDIVRDGESAVIQTQLLALHADRGTVGGPALPLLAEIIASTEPDALGPGIDAAFGAEGVYLQLTAVTEDAAPLRMELNGIAAADGDVQVNINEGQSLVGEPLLELTLSDGSVITGEQLDDQVDLALITDDTIGYAFDHGLTTSVLDEDTLFYSSGDGEPIGGLVDGATYFVQVVDTRHIRLARSLLEAQDAAVTAFGGADVGLDNTIDLGYEHGYRTGDAVRYRSGGGDAIGGLIDGTTYYVIEVGATTIALAESEQLAHAMVSAGFDPAAIGDGGGVDGALDTITFAAPHGFSTGDPVVYQSDGGDPLGGLVNGGVYFVDVVDDLTIRLERAPEAAADDPSAFFSGASDVFAEPDEIQLGYAHRYQAGDAVVYRNGGGSSVGGLVDGQTYYVVVLGPNNTRIALSSDRTAALNAKNEVFDPSAAIDNAADSIDLGHTHGFSTGDAVVYSAGGDSVIGGLTNLNTYYVVVLGDSVIGLAASYDDATAVTPVLIDLDASVATGNTHRLWSDVRVQLDPSVASGSAHSLRLDLSPSGAAGREHMLTSDNRISLDGSTATGDSHTLRIALDPSAATGARHTLRGNVFYMSTDQGIVPVDSRDVVSRRRVRPVTSVPTSTEVRIVTMGSERGSVRVGAGVTGEAPIDVVLTGLISTAVGGTDIGVRLGDITNAGQGQLIRAAHAALATLAGKIGTSDDPILLQTGRLDAGATGGIYLGSIDGNLGIGAVGSTGGDVVIGTSDTNATDETVSMLEAGFIIADSGRIEIQVADVLAVADGYTIRAAGQVLIEGDRGAADPGSGATIRLSGAVITGSEVLLLGGGDGDELSLVGALYTAPSVRLVGRGGDDLLLAGASAVTAEGRAGDDLLIGGMGDDVLLGGPGDDRIRGGPGDDSFVGGDGRDTADYSDAPGPVVAVIDGLGADDGYGDQDSLSEIEVLIGSDYDDSLTGSARDDEIRGGAGDDLILGVAGNDLLFGNAGMDEMQGGAGDDRLNGGPGDDLIVGGAGSDTIVFDDAPSGVYVDLLLNRVIDDGWDDSDIVRGVENIVGSAYRDRLIGDEAANEIDGAAGFDRIEGRAGDDTLFGGSGNDKIYGGYGNDRLDGGTGHDLIRGNEGTDTLTFTAAVMGVFVSLHPGVVHDDGTGSVDVVFDIENVIGTEYDDEIHGDRSANMIDGGAGDDLIFGGAGDDLLLGGTGDDEIHGGTGDDTIFGGDGDDALFGDAGDDYIDGGAGDDVIDGGDGDDVVLARTGRDTVNGGAGSDELYGGAGDDTLIGGAGDDVIGGGDGDDMLRGSDGEDRLSGGSGEDVLMGEAGADVLAGGAGDDRVDGGAGDDVLRGNEDDDELSGGSGNDELYGGSGDDVLDGGSGVDLVVAGGGNDVIVPEE